MMSNSDVKIIQLNNLSFGYDGDLRAISDLNFSVARGESVGIIGSNGCGKSTLFKLMAGLIGGDGNIEIKGLKVVKKNLPEIRRALGFMFQDSDNQMFMPTVFDDMIFGPSNYGLSKEDAARTVDETLDKLGISHLRDRHNYALSGGEKRMAALATILAMKPEILLLDEPTTGLDPYSRRKIIGNLNSMKETRLIASHDLDMILECCERVILLDKGTVVADDKAEKILSNRELLESCHLELPFCMQDARVYGKM